MSEQDVIWIQTYIIKAIHYGQVERAYRLTRLLAHLAVQ